MKRKIDLNKIFDELFPICRSITGEGYIKSLNILSRFIPLKKLNYRSEKKIFDWKVPKIWKIKEAYIKLKNKKIIDFKKNNLHVINYSHPVNLTNVPFKKVKKFLNFDKKYKNAIPYITSYYKKKNRTMLKL